MSIEAELPDGRVLEFPDGTDPSVIQSTVKRELGVEQPQLSFGDQAIGALETASTLITGAIAEPLSGLFGAYEAFRGGDPSALIPYMQKELTYEARTEAGKQQIQKIGEVLQPVGEAFKSVEETLGESVLEATGSPELAAIAHSLPTAVLEMLGIKGLGRVKKPSISKKEISQRKSFVAQGFEPKEFDKNKIFTDSSKKKQLDKALASGNQESVAAMIDADPEFFKALDELGSKEKGLPSAASKNLQYQQTEQALKKIPGSDLARIEADQITELQNISDRLITEFGGTTDKSALSVRLLDDSQKSIKELDTITEKAYSDIGESVPKSAIIDMKATRGSMREEIKSLRGEQSQMSSLERKLLKMSDEKSNTTYHAVDKIRKVIGETLNKKTDAYKNESSGKLKKLYAILSEDQGNALKAESFNMGTKYSPTKMVNVKSELPVPKGLGEAWDAAKKLVVKRKVLEDASINMFGKNLSDAFMPKLGLATKKLSSGEYKKFFELIESVPKKNRQEVIISALNDAFTTGSRKEKQLSVAGYADWYNGLSKNKKLKNTYYQYLPRDLTKKLDAIGKVTNGIRNAQAAAPIGGQIMASTGVVSKVIDGVGRRLLSKLPGFIGALVEVGLEKGKTKGLDSAIELLTDRNFIENINAIAKGQLKKAEKLEERLMKTKKMKDFINTLPTNEATALSVLGLIPWLSMSDEQ